MEYFVGIDRWVNRTTVAWQYIYETRIAPGIALFGYWLVYPFARIVASQRIRFIWNMADGTGHIIPELDNFFHQEYLQELEKGVRYILIRPKNTFSDACIKKYGHKFVFARASNLLYDLILPMVLAYPPLAHDIASSRLRWQIPTDKPLNISKPWQTYLYIVSKEEQDILNTAWGERRNKTTNPFPLYQKEIVRNKELDTFLGDDPRPLCLVHIKISAMNSTALPTDPKTYIQTLRFLMDAGYRIILVGREKMPKEFFDLGVLNYSQSSIATFGNDIDLFSRAKVAIISGSGINWLAGCYGIPYLYVNYWHISKTPPEKLCIAVPTLIKKRGEQAYMSAKEQMDMYYYSEDHHEELFPYNEYEPRNASEDEILYAMQELLALRETYEEPTEEQKKIYATSGYKLLELSKSRISSYFIQKHSEVFR
ncbi:MAG: hypothetical protein A3E36_02080 [Candidatus Andersenbacteria bacterium RIFCSPHIGHO2_12_FULL_45_11b]|uniref:Glycosyltransferase n=1 Tax=Candidatus Andersenbacteria bacterium RIFCSPHIGHO2_12_FULL_45_11b TaxID=1797282 RepID=A0A1G1XBE9_9BACT|nr:MAG: hypothetical protein A3E36_02080 [Candidatus Andersenbacteria bacterium RIFCSPHIGHO2_12_FULL_45_11b]